MNRLNMNHQNPRGGFLALLTVSLAVMLAFGVFLQTGWRSCRAALNTVSGDADKLSNFTVSFVHFMDTTGRYFEEVRLEDGALQSSFHIGEVQNQGNDHIWSYMTGTVLPDEHNALDAAASAGYVESIGATSYVTQSGRCLWMATVHSEEGVVRFPMEELSLKEPVFYYAAVQKDGTVSDYQTQDASWMTELENASSYYFGKERIPLGDTWGFCQRFSTQLRAAGLYRVIEDHTYAEIAAFPADGTMQGKPVLLQSASIGETELFYSTPDCLVALEGYDMEDGAVLFLYVDQNRRLAADLVSREGVCTDRWQNIPVELRDTLTAERSVPEISRMARQNASQLVLLLSASKQSGESCLLVLQTKQEKIVTKTVQNCPASREPILVQLNDAGDAVLEMTESVREFTTRNHVNPNRSLSDEYVEGYSVTVRSFPDGELLYEGLLDVGTQRDWRLQWYAMGNESYRVSYARNSLSVIQEKGRSAQ